MTVRVVTCNTQGKTDSLTDFRATVQAVHDQAPAFVGWQEVKTDRQRNVLRVTGADYTHHHTDLAVPISVHADWIVLSTGRRKAHDGRTNASPARWVVWVEAVHRATGETIIFANTHLVSGAWNRKPKPHKTWRKHMWTDHWQLLRDLAAAWSRSCPVVIVGDFNRVNVTPFAHFAWIDNRGIDKIAAYGLTGTSPRRILTRSDHGARAVELTLKETA